MPHRPGIVGHMEEGHLLLGDEAVFVCPLRLKYGLIPGPPRPRAGVLDDLLPEVPVRRLDQGPAARAPPELGQLRADQRRAHPAGPRPDALGGQLRVSDPRKHEHLRDPSAEAPHADHLAAVSGSRRHFREKPEGDISALNVAMNKSFHQLERTVLAFRKGEDRDQAGEGLRGLPGVRVGVCAKHERLENRRAGHARRRAHELCPLRIRHHRLHLSADALHQQGGLGWRCKGSLDDAGESDDLQQKGDHGHDLNRSLKSNRKRSELRVFSLSQNGYGKRWFHRLVS